MPQNDKKLPEITDNLDQFVDKLFNHIADESEKARISLIATLVTAQQLYKMPFDSWTTGWFYQYDLARKEDIEHAINHIGAFPDEYTRLYQIKKLTDKESWKPGSSYNFYLFSELVKLVPGYKPLEAELVYPITLKVKNKLMDKIDQFMIQHQNKEKERLLLDEIRKKSVENVLVFNNLESAQLSVKENQDKIHFCLFYKNKLWQLSWIDFTGKIYKLEPSDELIKILIDQDIIDVVNVSLVQLKDLKIECNKVRNLFLDKIQVLVNPRNAANHMVINNESLVDEGFTATFVLRGEGKPFSLYWISVLGKVNEINLEKYTLLNQWLNTQNRIEEEDIPHLKSYLLHVKTTSLLSCKTGMLDFKNELQNCIDQGPKTSKVIKSVPMHAPKRLDLSLFAEVAKSLEDKRAVNTVSSIVDKKSKATDKKSQKISDLEKYAAISQLFGNKEKTRPKIVEESLALTQPRQ